MNGVVRGHYSSSTHVKDLAITDDKNPHKLPPGEQRGLDFFFLNCDLSETNTYIQVVCGWVWI